MHIEKIMSQTTYLNIHRPVDSFQNSLVVFPRVLVTPLDGLGLPAEAAAGVDDSLLGEARLGHLDFAEAREGEEHGGEYEERSGHLDIPFA